MLRLTFGAALGDEMLVLEVKHSVDNHTHAVMAGVGQVGTSQ